jgi:hypothetical protein
LNRKALLLLAVVALLFIPAHQLPAPIQELPESPTPSPKPKPAHQSSTAHKSAAVSADVAKDMQKSKNSGGSATVFIYRPAGFPWGMYTTSVITIDGAEARTMADPRYSVRKLSPGRHIFEAKGGLTHQRIPIEIELEGDQKYYLRMSIDAWGFPEGKIIFTRVPSAQGIEETAKLTQGP